ncbi:MAG: 1-deoxy-D-xylulose-5-phosphate reductoisomerase [Hyphomicrobiaceae bacterium]
MPVQRVSVLGATGSVGTSTLDLIAHAPERFEVVALTAHTSVDRLAKAAIAARARHAVIGDPARYSELKIRLAGTGIEVSAGEHALEAAAAMPADCVVAAMVGAAGLKPALTAVAQGRRVALANKECLVTAGELFMEAVKRSGAELLPVDSEHSAVMQALGGAAPEAIERIVITASGGPFRTWELAEIARVTPEQALKHPNWSMGPKITIDSATMMNKGLELIEAFHLFPVTAKQLDVLVHPQSIIHALVEFRDGAVMAQLGSPDMRTPIAYALSFPERMQAPTARLDLVKLSTLTFEAPDRVKFRALALAEAALVRGGRATAILNAANEVAVDAFLQGMIGFLDIAGIVEDCLDKAEGIDAPCNIGSIDDILSIDAAGRRLAQDGVVARR